MSYYCVACRRDVPVWHICPPPPRPPSGPASASPRREPPPYLVGERGPELFMPLGTGAGSPRHPERVTSAAALIALVASAALGALIGARVGRWVR